MNTVLTDGISVMLIGMGTVLCFLCILIISMHIMSGIVIYLNKIFPEIKENVNNTKPSGDDCIALAIAAVFNKK